jgi:hypothetical protein
VGGLDELRGLVDGGDGEYVIADLEAFSDETSSR